MKFTLALASTIACLTASSAMPQGGPESPCTYTSTACNYLLTGPFNGIETITEYAATETAIATVNCQGCADATILSEHCGGPGPKVSPITATEYLFTDVPTTTTAGVCSPTP